MTRRPALAALAGVLLMAASPSLAQAPAPLPDPDAVLVEELVVTGRLPGPAWWTVSDADTTVYVLGAPSLAPKRMQWDRAVFERRLEGANAVILPFQEVKVSVTGALGAGFNLLRLRSRTPFEETLDPATRARFVAARELIGQPARRYGTKNALAAGLQLAADYRERFELTTSDPTKLIKLLAEQGGVPVVEKSYRLGPLLGAVLRTPDRAGRACFDEVLAQVEAGPALTRQAAVAWAEGDLRAALDNERTYERCIASVPGAQAFDARMKADQAKAIAEALKTPGHAIAVTPLRPLLSRGGVLDRLRAEGYEVRTPGDLK